VPNPHRADGVEFNHRTVPHKSTHTVTTALALVIQALSPDSADEPQDMGVVVATSAALTPL